jgi:hypothetical protein
MKKLSLFFVLTFAASFVFGQFSIGPRVGFTSPSLSSELDDVKADVKSSFNFGAFARFGKKLYLQPEVIWHKKNSEITRSASSGLSPISQDIEVSTIEIPAIIGIRLLNLGVGNVRLLAGPSATIAVDKTVTTTSGNDFINPITTADIEDLVWGFNIGGGIDVLMFTLDIRYQFGLSEIIKTADGLDFNTKSNVFAVSLGWKIL